VRGRIRRSWATGEPRPALGARLAEIHESPNHAPDAVNQLTPRAFLCPVDFERGSPRPLLATRRRWMVKDPIGEADVRLDVTRSVSLPAKAGAACDFNAYDPQPTYLTFPHCASFPSIFRLKSTLGLKRAPPKILGLALGTSPRSRTRAHNLRCSRSSSCRRPSLWETAEVSLPEVHTDAALSVRCYVGSRTVDHVADGRKYPLRYPRNALHNPVADLEYP
jgi:hypothetical protein